MKRIFILLLCLFTFGCEQKKVISKAEREQNDLEISNYMNEDLELLAIKYDINIKVLVDAIDEYEELTTGYGFTKEIYYSNKANNVTKEKETSKPKSQIVNIPTAIDIVSNKYRIPKEKITNILIDKKMMEEIE